MTHFSWLDYTIFGDYLAASVFIGMWCSRGEDTLKEYFFAGRSMNRFVVGSVSGSGGDILNISLNAIHAGSADADPKMWRVTQGMLEREIEKPRVAKAEHSGRTKRGRRAIGF